MSKCDMAITCLVTAIIVNRFLFVKKPCILKLLEELVIKCLKILKIITTSFNPLFMESFICL